MELRELAERILFGKTLEDKLTCPDRITDSQPGQPIEAPPAPGRPAHLQFKARHGSSSEFPSLSRLSEEQERGRLLHFFANHELLATELMALVLLRFPDAPVAFRRGVLHTLRDEQAHTRLYIERMRACGIEFGELPVSGFFWRSISGMRDPMDYVAGLSLTFEQANLDFCRAYAARLAELGDSDSAQLLDRIYRDEIAHVAYGLKWFRHWKDPNETDWAAYARKLPPPLSPQRAKGTVFNAEGRRAAGLDEQFILQLAVYSRSKGRTPGVFVFNPFAEGHIARGHAFTPTRHQALMAEDLAALPQFLSASDDVVLVPERPRVEFLNQLRRAGFTPPEFIRRIGNRIDPDSDLPTRKIGRLRPWAWGPDALELLGPLTPNVTGEQRTLEQRFNSQIADLHGKVWSTEFLKRFLAQHRSPAWLCGEDELGIVADSESATLRAITEIRRRGHHRVVIKEDLGLAGHNAIRLFEPEILATQRRWIARTLEQSRRVVVEAWLERVVDLSIQFEMTSRGLELKGYTRLFTDARGQYRGNLAYPEYRRRIPLAVTRLLSGPVESAAPHTQFGENARRIEDWYQDLFRALETELQRIDYLGPLGIDAFVYRVGSNACRLKPMVEINPRYTMGRVLVELMRNVCPGSHGFFRLVTLAEAQKVLSAASNAAPDSAAVFPRYAQWLQTKWPLQMEGSPVPRIREGAVILTDPEQANACVAILRASRTEVGLSAE